MNILAIDVGTASISTALAVKKSSKTAPERQLQVLKVFRYQLNLIGEELGKEESSRVPHILKDALSKAFKEAYSISKHVEAVLICFSDPFFLDEKLSKSFERPLAGKFINAEEISAALRSIKEEIAHSKPSLLAVGEEILNTRVNGYDVKNAVGYCGKALEIEAVFTFISPTLQNYVTEIKEKFFPRAKISYYSDARIMRKALKAVADLSEPVLMLDIGGEVTGIFRIDSENVEHLSATPFGIRTIERRVSRALKVNQGEAESLLKMYSASALKDALKEKLDKIIAGAVADWWLEIFNSLKAFGEGGTQRNVMISGGGGDFDIFLRQIREGMQKEYGLEVEPTSLRAEAFKDFFAPPLPFSGGSDVILASMLVITA